MPALQTCPPRERFLDLISGRVSSEEWNVLSEHVETCPHCIQTLADLPDPQISNWIRDGAKAKVSVPVELIQRLKLLAIPSDTTWEHSAANSKSNSDSSLTPSPRFPMSQSLPTEMEIGALRSYRILHELGRGGMGIVYEALDERLNRRVALKVMNPKYKTDSVARERFLREARNAARAKDERIITVYEVDEDQGTPYLVMELLDGESLDSRMKRQKLSLPETLSIASEIAYGLAAAHEQNIIHRDIKPSNIWLTQRGKVKLLDFGLASMANDPNLTAESALIGTPSYMSPEQAHTQPLDSRTDLFSLGVVLYEMLTSQKPFQGSSLLEILKWVTEREPTSPQQIRPEIPQAVSDFTLTLLRKKRDERPQSTFEVAQRLTSLAQSLLPVSTPSAAVQPAKAPRSNRYGIALGFTLLVALIASAVIYQIVRVKDKDGNTVAEIKVPKDGKVEILEVTEKKITDTKTSDAKTTDTKEEKKADPKKIDPIPLNPIPPKEALPKENNSKELIPLLVPKKDRPKLVPESQQVPPLKGREPLSPFALVAQPSKIEGVRSWTLATKTMLEKPTNYAISPDGKTLAGTSLGGDIYLWEMDTGKLKKVFTTETQYSHLLQIAWQSDNKTLVVSPGKITQSGMQLVDSETGKTIRSWSNSPQVISISPNGKFFTSYSSADHNIYEITEKGPVNLDIRVHVRNGAGWDPTGFYFGAFHVPKDNDRPNDLFSVTSLKDIQNPKRFHVTVPLDPKSTHFYDSSNTAISPDGKFVAFFFREETQIWDVLENKKTATKKAPYNGAWSPDSKSLVLFEKDYSISQDKRRTLRYNALDWKQEPINIGQASKGNNTFNHAQFSLDSSKILLAVVKSSIGFFMRPLKYSPSEIRKLDGTLLAKMNCYFGPAVSLYNPKMGNFTTTTVEFQGDFPGENRLTVSPDGHYLCTNPEIEKDLFYLVQLFDGTQLNLSQQEFETKYGWKNDPEKVKSLTEKKATPAKNDKTEPASGELLPEPTLKK